MASTCPKCHKPVDEDVICCAEIRYTWKCKSCGKLSTGFAIPYGRCFLCGGENEVVEGYAGANPDQVAIVQDATRYELDMYQFYRLARARTSDPLLKEVLEELYLMEEDHIAELESKYHLHLDPHLLDLPEKAEQIISQWIFEGINFDDHKGHVPVVYDKAIAMERRTRDYFKQKADALPPGSQKEIYRELAAEEEEHVAILESERAQLG